MYRPEVTVDEAIVEYLQTGRADQMHPEWPGAGFFDRATRAEEGLHAALVAEVRRRSKGKGWGSRVDVPADMAAFTRSLVEPMVRGLFSRSKHESILNLLERSAVLVTDANVEDIIRGAPSLSTGWNVANFYLVGVGAEALGGTGSYAGFSTNLKCYVTPEYFEQKEPFVDFLIHECAHVLHDCKFERIELRATRSRERLVELEFRERETFAYSCEAFSSIAMGRSPSGRAELAARFRSRKPYPRDAVDVEKVEQIVTEAAPLRNGWKRVLERCAPTTPPKYRLYRKHRGDPRHHDGDPSGRDAAG